MENPYLHQAQQNINQCSSVISDVMPALSHDVYESLQHSMWPGVCGICANKIVCGKRYRRYESVGLDMCKSCTIWAGYYYCYAQDHTSCQRLSTADLRELRISIDKCRTRAYRVLAHMIIAKIVSGYALFDRTTQRCSICTRIIHTGTCYTTHNYNTARHMSNACDECDKKIIACCTDKRQCGTVMIFATPHIGHGIFPSDIIMLIAGIVHELICQL